MRTFFQEKMNMPETTFKASTQTASFGLVIGMLLSAILVVLILVAPIELLSVIISAIILGALIMKGKPILNSQAC